MFLDIPETYLTRALLKEPTPYNTYVIAGLPPTPISMVGREAIHAAMNPAPGNSLYFVARGDGSHVFSANLDAHNAAVKEFQLKRRADYRSSPAPATNPTPATEPASGSDKSVLESTPPVPPSESKLPEQTPPEPTESAKPGALSSTPEPSAPSDEASGKAEKTEPRPQ